MNYQWQCWKPEGEEDENEDWQDLTCDGVKFQEVKAGLKLTAVQACDAGYYRCVVSNSAGSEPSQCAKLVVGKHIFKVVNITCKHKQQTNVSFLITLQLLSYVTL